MAKKTYMRCKLILIISLLLSGVACSNSEQQQREKPPETAAEQIGREAAAQIKATIHSAEMVRQIQNQHTEQVQGTLEQQNPN